MIGLLPKPNDIAKRLAFVWIGVDGHVELHPGWRATRPRGAVRRDFNDDLILPANDFQGVGIYYSAAKATYV